MKMLPTPARPTGEQKDEQLQQQDEQLRQKGEQPRDARVKEVQLQAKGADELGEARLMLEMQQKQPATAASPRGPPAQRGP